MAKTQFCARRGVLLLGWVGTGGPPSLRMLSRPEWIVALGVMVGAVGTWRARRRGLNVQLERTGPLEAACLIARIGLMITSVFARTGLFWAARTRACM